MSIVPQHLPIIEIYTLESAVLLAISLVSITSCQACRSTFIEVNVGLWMIVIRRYYLTLIGRDISISLVNTDNDDNSDLTNHLRLCEASLNYFRFSSDSCTDIAVHASSSSNLSYTSSDTIDKRPDSDLNSDGNLE